MKGQFFAIGKPQWNEACKLGLNSAVALLALGRGTGHDNVTTAWSAKAISGYTGMSWVRANNALALLDRNPRIVASVTPNGKRRLRKLVIPEDSARWLWLPNALVTGARNEASPVARFRQAQNLEHLQTFIELYGAHDLMGDGGLPRSMLWTPYDVRERICERGPFTVWGFRDSKGLRYGNRVGPFARFQNRRGKVEAFWDCVLAFDRLGLLERVDYLAEGDSPDAELLHPLTGDENAQEVHDALLAFGTTLPARHAPALDTYDYVIPVLRHIEKPAVVGVYRLVYRPHTGLTAAWYARHCESCTGYAERYDALLAGDLREASRAPSVISRAVKAVQGGSTGV